MKAKWLIAVIFIVMIFAASVLFPHKRHVVILPGQTVIDTVIVADTVTVADTVWQTVPPETVVVETTKIRVDTIYKELRYTYPEAITELEKVGDTLRFSSIQPIDSGYAYQKQYYYLIFTCGDFRVESTGDSFFRIGSLTQIYYLSFNHNRVFHIGDSNCRASDSKREVSHYTACISRAGGLGYWLRSPFLKGERNA